MCPKSHELAAFMDFLTPSCTTLTAQSKKRGKGAPTGALQDMTNSVDGAHPPYKFEDLTKDFSLVMWLE